MDDEISDSEFNDQISAIASQLQTQKYSKPPLFKKMTITGEKKPAISDKTLLDVSNAIFNEGTDIPVKYLQKRLIPKESLKHSTKLDKSLRYMTFTKDIAPPDEKTDLPHNSSKDFQIFEKPVEESRDSQNDVLSDDEILPNLFKETSVSSKVENEFRKHFFKLWSVTTFPRSKKTFKYFESIIPEGDEPEKSLLEDDLPSIWNDFPSQGCYDVRQNSYGQITLKECWKAFHKKHPEISIRSFLQTFPMVFHQNYNSSLGQILKITSSI